MGAPELKFCGLTRAEDARAAAELGAAYVGVIFAGGPRRLDVPAAERVLRGVETTSVQRVGVFGPSQDVGTIIEISHALGLDVVQLHDSGTADRTLMLRERFFGAIWVVLGVNGATFQGVPVNVDRSMDAFVLDTAVGGRSGGTGVTFDWAGVAPAVAALRTTHRIVLAGGLRPSNVREAVRTLAPHVVDVSSGVESAPGIKDPELMRAFAVAARSPEER
ncbi:MAG: phosphoribosylanthranilate isomerase [Gemmatimonadaceae bacterium]